MRIAYRISRAPRVSLALTTTHRMDSLQMKRNYLLAALVILCSLSLPVSANADTQKKDSTEVSSNIETNANIPEDHPVRNFFKHIGNEIRMRAEENKVEMIMRTDLKKSSSTSEEKKEMKEESKEVKREMKENRKDSIQFPDRAIANVSSMFMLTAERLETIIERIESQLEKISASGGITITTEHFVELAKTDLVRARASINTLSSTDSDVDSAAKTDFATVKKLSAEIREELKSAKKHLLDAVVSLKDAEKTVR